MNDRDWFSDKNITENEDEEFESGKELRGGSTDDDEIHFGSKKEKEDYVPDFTDEMEYSGMAREKTGFFSRLTNWPSVSVGWVVLFIIVLVALFLFLPSAGRNDHAEEIAALMERVKNLEEQSAQAQKPAEPLNPEALDLSGMKEMQDRVGALERTLSAIESKLRKDIDDLNVKLAELRPEKTVEKAPAKAKPTVEKATPQKAATVKASEPAIQYHTVKAGDNLFRISLKYGLKQEELLRLNNLEKNAVIVPGQKIRVSK
jgi:LysM repeat protein